jgi:hypothetical protein
VLRRQRRVPLPLGLLLVVATLQTLAWIVVLPAFQGPDEDSHLSYVQRIVEEKTVPWKPQGGIPPQGVRFSEEMQRAENLTGLGSLIGNLAARPGWTSADVALWERGKATLTAADRDSGGRYTASLKNPPVYYLYSSIPYAAAHGGSIFDRLELVRLWNIPLLLVALVFVWLVIGELVADRRLQVIGTTAAALLPQLSNVTAGVAPDVLLVAEWSAALYLMLLVLRRGPRPRLVAALAAVFVLAGFTHARSLPMFVPALLAVLLALARERGWRAITPLRAFAAVGVVFLLVVAVAAARGKGDLHQFVSYVWQFYLPKLGFMTAHIGPPHYGFREAYVDRLYSDFAWLEVVVPTNVEKALWWLSLAALVAFVVVLVRRRAVLRARLAETVVLLSAVLALLLGLHLAAYRAMLADPTDPIVTARYLLPLLPLFGTVVAVVVGALPRRASALLGGLVLALGASLQLGALGLLVERFYA